MMWQTNTYTNDDQGLWYGVTMLENINQVIKHDVNTCFCFKKTLDNRSHALIIYIKQNKLSWPHV